MTPSCVVDFDFGGCGFSGERVATPDPEFNPVMVPLNRSSGAEFLGDRGAEVLCLLTESVMTPGAVFSFSDSATLFCNRRTKCKVI